MENLRTTPLSKIHRRLGAQMVPFGGFEMPLMYEGIIKEHIHTRQHASVFDVSHMGELNLKGPTAIKDVTKLVAGRVFRLEVGQCTYGFFLNKKGSILDDLITYRLGDNEFNLVVNAANKKGK